MFERRLKEGLCDGALDGERSELSLILTEDVLVREEVEMEIVDPTLSSH